MLSSILYPLSSLFTRSPAHPLTRSPSLGVVLALAAMTRPEGMLVAAVCGLHLLATSWLAGRVAWRRLLGLALGFLVIFGPYYLWRFGYYGYPLPNTFYAKVGGTLAQVQRGLGYAAAFAASQAPLVVIALVGLLPLKNKEPKNRVPSGRTENREPGVEDGGWRMEDSKKSAPARLVTLSSCHLVTGRRWSVVGGPSSFLWLLVGVYTLYIVAVGGDHFPLFRFFVPLLPPLALLGGLALGRLGRLLPLIVAASTRTLLVAAAIGWQAPQLYASRTLNGQSGVWTENTVVEKNREIGLWLRGNTAPGTLIGTGIAGALPFYAERPVLDMLGLNDLHIAHMEAPTIGQGVAGSEKTDNDYILRRRPDYIPYNSAGTLFEVPQFLELYERGIVHGPEGRWLRLYKRRDLAAPPGWTALDSQ
jgi:arabinofuranosyltransferase